jgi:integrase
MARQPTGSAYERDGKLYALVTLPKRPGETKARRIPKACPPKVKTLEQAKAWSAWLSEQLRTGNLVLDEPEAPAPAGETFEAWCERWLADRAARNMASVKDDRSRLRVHVWPWLNGRAMADITTSDLERLVQRLDARIHDGTLSWRTARNIWGVVSKAFADARRSKNLSLRVRADNPAVDVAPPDEGVTKTKVYLYPSEVSRYLACADVPLRWRRVVAVAIYLYVRAGELEALDWSDVDLDRGIIHVHRSVDRFREKGTEKGTKTGEARKLLIEPALLPLLRALHVEAGSPVAGRVIKMPPAQDLSHRFRGYLERAGVVRGELHAGAGDATRKQLTWHDLRATGITWRAVRGDDPLRIQHDAGHRNFSTTQGYIREASNLGSGFGEVFPALPSCLLAGASGG